MLESEYQADLVATLRSWPEVVEIIINDPVAQQGIPDLLILGVNGRWAFLEVKRSAKAKQRPNQDYYIKKYGQASFSSFIYPENEEEVLLALQQALRH